MKSTIFATVFAVTTLTAFAAPAQVAGFNGTINQQQALDTGVAQRILCQTRASRACVTSPGGQQRETGNRRTGQRGGQARP